MKERVYLSGWRSGEAEQRFRALEDELARELIDEPPARVEVPTRLGPTQAYRWPGRGEPVVWLHGTAGTSLMWAPYGAGRGGRAMYAIDTIGDVGRSRQQIAVENAADLADWLAETLAGLGLDRVHLAGTSYGGFLGLNLAAHRPEKVRSLFLIEPCGIERVRMLRFLLWGTSALLASRLPASLRKAAAKRLRMPALEDPRVLRLALYGQRHHRSRLLPPDPLTDAQLRSIDQPVYLLLGDKSEVFPTQDVHARAEATLPTATVERVEHAGHALATSHVDLATDRLATFLRRQAPHPGP